jgi:hypothetical protein
MYKYNRTEFFRNRDYGPFLNSALNRFSNFNGIEGFHTSTQDGQSAVDMDPTRTKDMASARIQAQHFTASTPTPAFDSNRTPHNWESMETWFRDMFYTTYTPDTNPAYDHVIEPITAAELHYRIKCLKKNKAGGRSGITADILQMRLRNHSAVALAIIERMSHQRGHAWLGKAIRDMGY